MGDSQGFVKQSIYGEHPDEEDVPWTGLILFDSPMLIPRESRRGASDKGHSQAPERILIHEGRPYHIEYPKLTMLDLKALQSKRRNTIYSPGDIELLLHNIRPVLSFESKGKIWRQLVSNKKATRLDVWDLSQRLAAMLSQRHAKPYGICPNRRLLYRQCADDILRQEIIDLPDRGILFIRLWEEIKKTISFYEHIVAGGTEYGMKKTSQVSRTHKSSEETINQLHEQKKLLIEQKQLLHQLKEEKARQFLYSSTSIKWQHEAICNKIRRANQQLASLIEVYKTPIIKLKGSTASVLAVERAWDKAEMIRAVEELKPISKTIQLKSKAPVIPKSKPIESEPNEEDRGSARIAPSEAEL